MKLMKTNSIPARLAAHVRTTATTRHLIFRSAWLWISFLTFATIAFAPQPTRAAVTEAWVQRYGSEAGTADEARKVVTDAAGNVIVAGTTYHTQTCCETDMLPWTNLSALLIGLNGSAQFQDTHSPYPAGFYRARQQ